MASAAPTLLVEVSNEKKSPVRAGHAGIVEGFDDDLVVGPEHAEFGADLAEAFRQRGVAGQAEQEQGDERFRHNLALCLVSGRP